MALNLERKKGSYGCVRNGQGWDTCTVCNSGTQKECEFYMTCSKWTNECQPENCYECEVYLKDSK